MTTERVTTEDFAADLDALGIPEDRHAPFLAYVSNVYGDPHRELAKEDVAYDAAQEFEKAYCGDWDSEREFAESDDGGAAGLFDGIDCESVVVRYFDWDSWTRDLFVDDYWSADSPGYGKYVFRNM